jgi:hypothetical protein
MRLVKRLAALALVQFFAVAAAPAGGIIVLGDSMTGGGAKGAAKVSNRWQAWPYKLGLPASKVRNLAVWGSGYTNGEHNFMIAGLEADKLRASDALLFVWGGYWDICKGRKTGEELFAAFEAWLAARVAAGWAYKQIVVLTIIDAGDGCFFGPRMPVEDYDARRKAFNLRVASKGAELGFRVVRLDLDPRLGVRGASSKNIYFKDKVHPRDLGQTVVAELVRDGF